MGAYTRHKEWGIFRGDLVIKARKTKGMNQFELAEKSGVSRTTISNLEAGLHKNPRMDIIANMAIALDIPVGELFDLSKASNAS